jgi:AcrR family transcriptional regulator
LIDAALEVFSTKGYRNTSVEDLTRSAGASRATFYLHFSSKFDILVKASAVATQDTPDLYAAIDLALAEGSRPALEAALDNIIKWFEAHSGLLQAAAEAAMEDPSIILRTDRLFDLFFEAMPFVRSQWPRPTQAEAKLRLHLFVLQLERFFQNYAATGRWAFPRDALVRVLADVWSTDFLPPAAATKPTRARPRTKASADAN